MVRELWREGSERGLKEGCTEGAPSVSFVFILHRVSTTYIVIPLELRAASIITYLRILSDFIVPTTQLLICLHAFQHATCAINYK